MDSATIDVYNFSGNVSPPISFVLIGESSQDEPIRVESSPRQIPPNTPDTPTQIIAYPTGFDTFAMQIEIPNAAGAARYYSVNLNLQIGVQTVYLVANPTAQYTSSDSGNVATPIDQDLYSAGKQQDSAAIINGSYYMKADDYDFGDAYVVSLNQSTDFSVLTLVDDVWDPSLPGNISPAPEEPQEPQEPEDPITGEESPNYVLIAIVVFLAIVVVVIVIAVVVSALKNKGESDSAEGDSMVSTQISSPMALGY